MRWGHAVNRRALLPLALGDGVAFMEVDVRKRSVLAHDRKEPDACPFEPWMEEFARLCGRAGHLLGLKLDF